MSRMADPIGLLSKSLSPEDKRHLICPICSATAKPDLAAWHALSLDAAPKSHMTLKCSGCGLRWLDPFPSPQEYASLYDEEYYGSVMGVESSYSEQKTELRACYERIVQRFRALGIRDGLLDIGCGTGDFLTAAVAGHIQCRGIELSRHATDVATSRGHEVWHGSLEELQLPPGMFNAAHCSHVLEHVTDAHDFLEHVRAVLKPGSPVYFEVPLQFDCILDRYRAFTDQRRQFSVFSIHHNYFFSPRAMRNILGQHGFEVISLRTHLPCRRKLRPAGIQKWLLQLSLWLADRVALSGDVIAVWARTAR
jgi:SAM-dependent methyltransferase